MIVNTPEILIPQILSLMAMEFRIISIIPYTKDSGKTDNSTGRESLLGLMAHLTRASIWQAKSTELENLFIIPKRLTMASG
jgi:hypothetical protein